MSKLLMIRHLPTALSFQDKERLLKHFGAENVWETSTKRNYVFASFSTIEKAKESLLRLHQLEIAHRRLVVEYSFDKEPVTRSQKNTDEASCTTKVVREFLKMLNAWNPSVDFYQPPPPNLKYKYPDITPEVSVNLLHALFTHKAFYTQTLHLMNKMCLDVPFKDDAAALSFFKETFRKFFVGEIVPLPPSDTESEISSDEIVEKTQQGPALVKRKRKLPVPSRKRPAVMPTTPAAVKKKAVTQEEVFEMTTVQEPKKISLVVNPDALQKPTEEPEIIGELGKFEKEEQRQEPEDVAAEPEQPSITKKELLKNRLSYRDMKVLPVYKNYHPGQPSMRLYIKNLAKTVTEQDVKRIYRRYVEGLTDDELTGFDVRVMQEGRMKGQAFVTFPSVVLAETALNETNGYMLKERPMVVQFARVANKKSVQ